MSIERPRRRQERIPYQPETQAEFLMVKMRAAQMQPELPRLEQELDTFTAQLKDRADLSPAAKAFARVEQARGVLRIHGETLRRAAANLTDWTSAGQEIDALAEMLEPEGDVAAIGVGDETVRGGNADQLGAALAVYRTNLSELVEAARKAREKARARERGQVAGESRAGGDKPR